MKRSDFTYWKMIESKEKLLRRKWNNQVATKLQMLVKIEKKTGGIGIELKKDKKDSVEYRCPELDKSMHEEIKFMMKIPKKERNASRRKILSDGVGIRDDEDAFDGVL
jgi:hypothetical protein